MTTVFVTPNHDTSMVNSPTEDITYNGWANYETWNVALYIQNEYGLYLEASKERRDSYDEFIPFCEMYFDSQCTPDGVRWMDPTIDTDELDEMMKEL